jgi:hypothetical protein
VFLQHSISNEAEHNEHSEIGEKLFFLAGDREGHAFKMTGKKPRLRIAIKISGNDQ